MPSTTVIFREVTHRATTKINCLDCNKLITRSFVGHATYNPFNDGNPPDQAREDAIRIRDHAIQKGITCRWCEDRLVREALIRLVEQDIQPTYKGVIWLEERENIKEQIDNSICECCGNRKDKSMGYVVTEKGMRVYRDAREKMKKLGEDLTNTV